MLVSMPPKLSSENEETEVVFSHAALVTNMDKFHRMPRCKASFCFLIENTKTSTE